MTDTDRMVVWLREAMDAAERDAEAAAKDGTPDWYAKEHFAVADAAGEPVVYDEGRPTPDQVRHIVRHDPAAVLRRIAADRKMLDDLLAEGHLSSEDDTWYACASLVDADGDPVCPDDTRAPGPCDCGRDARVQRRVRLLAEGYGWTEETATRN